MRAKDWSCNSACLTVLGRRKEWGTMLERIRAGGPHDVEPPASQDACSAAQKQQGGPQPYLQYALLLLTDLPTGGARFYAEIARRSHALRDLPGPKYGLFGIVSAVRRGDIHRRAA